MTVVVLGVDALDPDLVNAEDHPFLTLNKHKSIETIVSASGEPSTHELWPTIITGLSPEEHGLTLSEDGVAWESDILNYGSKIADYLVPNHLQTKIGAWLLNNTGADAFRTPASYYERNGFTTVFDNRNAEAIGIPNYVVDPNTTDREHELRKQMGELFERDPDAVGGHVSSAPLEFYEQCMEMVMIRIARVRRALRSQENELIFGYTSGLDLIGHVAYDNSELQKWAYSEINEFVAELVDDLRSGDELLIVSDHGLQDGIHTDVAMVAGTSTKMVEHIDSVMNVRKAIEMELRNDHQPTPRSLETQTVDGQSKRVQNQLEDLGYI